MLLLYFEVNDPYVVISMFNVDHKVHSNYYTRGSTMGQVVFHTLVELVFLV